MREVAAEFERPALLFSGGKDSICLLRLAEKAFRPSDIPDAAAQHRHRTSLPGAERVPRPARAGTGRKLIVRTVESAIAKGIAVPAPGEDQPQPPADSHAARGHRGVPLRLLHRRRAARRGKGPRQGALLQLPRQLRPVGPEEPAPGNLEPLQRPAQPRREHARLSRSATGPRWTCGNTSARRSSKCRASTSAIDASCVRRHGQWLPVNDSRAAQSQASRSRNSSSASAPSATSSAPACVESPADTVDDIIAEIAAARVTERGSRADDKASEAAMEDRKKAGYF